MCLNKFSVLVMLSVLCSAAVIHEEKSSKRVCVIGAGIAGLSVARYLKEENINFTVLEVTQYVGGTWRYEPRIGTDENGMHLHTSMYKHLRTNLPKPTMELRGFPLPDDAPSFPSWEIFYNYLVNYTKHHDLYKHIQFLHNVVSVRRVGDIWKVKHQHVQTGEHFEEDYDYVVVGNGHFSKPNLPNITGENLFKGTIIHSHDYRVPDPYQNRRVVIVGAGPSGMDIAIDVATVASKVIHSHHSKAHFNTTWPSHYLKKPDIQEIRENGVVFNDGTYEEVDDVIYCTGFQFNYPFLDETSGLSITSHTVSPLHKYTVNINEPSMIIMGLVSKACLVVSLDAQARYATKLIAGHFTLPSREEMMQKWQKHVNTIKSKGLPMFFQHVLAEKEDQFYAELSEESGIERVPPVMFKIRARDMEAKLENLYTYRKYVYEIVDDNTFSRSIEAPSANVSLAP